MFKNIVSKSRIINKRNSSSTSSALHCKKKVFSGIQPSGSGQLHIGNFFGAIKKWVELQNTGDNDVSYCIVDLHSITLPQNPEALKENSLRICASLLACGIDPYKSTLFVQSSVKEHAELCWILTCITTMARLGHLPQYKEKSGNLKDDKIPLGLFLYPVLQAADIMLHKANLVPVGDDQIQHIQLAQHLTKNFNNRFGKTFPTCEPLIAQDISGRIKSLRDPTKKMSKSDVDFKSFINITDKPEEIRMKIKKSITDFTSALTYDPVNRPGVSNLITLHSIVAEKTPIEICNEFKHLDTGQYKPLVAEALIEYFAPIRIKIEDYLNNKEFLEKIILLGNEKARTVAEKTMTEVKVKVGLRN